MYYNRAEAVREPVCAKTASMSSLRRHCCRVMDKCKLLKAKNPTLFTGALVLEHARARGVDRGSTRLSRERIFVAVDSIHSERASSFRKSDRP